MNFNIAHFWCKMNFLFLFSSFFLRQKTSFYICWLWPWASWYCFEIYFKKSLKYLVLTLPLYVTMWNEANQAQQFSRKESFERTAYSIEEKKEIENSQFVPIFVSTGFAIIQSHTTYRKSVHREQLVNFSSISFTVFI